MATEGIEGYEEGLKRSKALEGKLGVKPCAFGSYTSRWAFPLAAVESGRAHRVMGPHPPLVITEMLCLNEW